jgi:hypothetical protein
VNLRRPAVLRANRLADLQRAAAAHEPMVFNELHRIVQAARRDQRVAAEPARSGSVGDAVAGDHLRWPQRGAEPIMLSSTLSAHAWNAAIICSRTSGEAGGPPPPW